MIVANLGITSPEPVFGKPEADPFLCGRHDVGPFIRPSDRKAKMLKCLRAAGRLATAAFSAHRIDRGFANQFGRHKACDEEFAAMIVELNGCAFGVRFRYDSESVLLVLDLLSSGKNLHVASLSRLPLPGHSMLRKAPSRQDSSKNRFGRPLLSLSYFRCEGVGARTQTGP